MQADLQLVPAAALNRPSVVSLFGATKPKTRASSPSDFFPAGYRSQATFSPETHLGDRHSYDGIASGAPVYVNGDPVNLIDPTGHCSTAACYTDVNGGDDSSQTVTAGENTKGWQPTQITQAEAAQYWAQEQAQKKAEAAAAAAPQPKQCCDFGAALHALVTQHIDGPTFPDACAGIQYSGTAIYGGATPGQGPAGALTGSGNFGACLNGDLFYAPSLGGFYQKPGGQPVCAPACGPNTIAQGAYGSFGFAPFASPGMHNAQEMGGPFQTSIASVGTIIGGAELTSSSSGPTTVTSLSTPGMPGVAGGAGFANLQTDTPEVYRYNWVGSLIDSPLANGASAIHNLTTWLW